MTYLVMPTIGAALTITLITIAFLISCCAALIAGFLARLQHADVNTITRNAGAAFASTLTLCMVVMAAKPASSTAVDKKKKNT